MSHWHVTVAETALAGIAFTFVGSYLTYIATRRGTRETVAAQERTVEKTIAAQREANDAAGELQVDLARKQRLFERRVETYLPLIPSLIRTQSCFVPWGMSGTTPPHLKELVDEFATEIMPFKDQQQTVLAFGGNEVAAAWRDAQQARRDLLNACRRAMHRARHERGEESDEPYDDETMEKIDKLIEAHVEVVDELIDTMRREIQS